MKIHHAGQDHWVNAGLMQFLSFRWYVKVLINGEEWWFPVLDTVN